GMDSVTALFGLLKTNQVSLVVIAPSNGVVSVEPLKPVYDLGESVTLTAIPSAGYSFQNWGSDASGTQNPLLLVLDTNKIVTADFILWIPTNPPIITQQPLSRTTGLGARTVFNVVAEGDGPFSYQWKFNGQPIPTGTGSSLELNQVSS